MVYYPDLSPYVYIPRGSGGCTLNVGWLDAEHAYPHDAVPDAFVERLWVFCRKKMLQTRGYHTCELCDALLEAPFQAQRDAEILKLGWAEIRVFGAADCVYAAPNLIYHYVVDHHYHPPEEFIYAAAGHPITAADVDGNILVAIAASV
jgi:hypothetical protein